jgi:Mn2+/Fe2+ NRAMP family transporter
MSDGPIIYPPLSEDLQQGVSWRSLKYFGAGAIVASVTIASGETIFAARSGALFGYTLLWCFVAGALMKGVQVYSGMRHMVLTGEHPMTHWGYMPGPKNWVPISIGLLSLFCFPFWQAALPLVLGGFMNWVVGVDAAADQTLLFARLWATLAIIVSVVLLLLRSYAFLERAQLIIVGLLLGCIFAATGAARPDWLAAILGMVTPVIPRYDPWILEKYPSIALRPPWVEVITCIGAVGGGTYDYVGYVGCLREKLWGAIGVRHPAREVATQEPLMPLAINSSSENLRAARRWLLPAQVDTAVCFSSVLLFTICFVILGARLLHPQQLVPADKDLLSHQAQFLTDLHPLLLYVYQLGIFMAFFGTIYGAYEIYFRTAFECLAPVSKWFRELEFETFRRGMLLYCATLGLIFLWTMKDPVSIITPAALIGGVFTCGLWCLAMLWADRRFLPPSLQMPWLLWALVAISGVVLTLLGAKGIADYVMGLLAA